MKCRAISNLYAVQTIKRRSAFDFITSDTAFNLRRTRRFKSTEEYVRDILFFLQAKISFDQSSFSSKQKTG